MNLWRALSPAICLIVFGLIIMGAMTSAQEAQNCTGPNDLPTSDPTYLPSEEDRNCGASRVSGSDGLGRYPSVALIGVTNTFTVTDPENPFTTKNITKFSPTCAGALINGWYVLTPASCIVEGITKVVVGDWYLGTNPDCDGEDVEEELLADSLTCSSVPRLGCQPCAQFFDIKEGAVTVHEDYKAVEENAPAHNNIALIKLDRLVDYNSGVKTVCLPPGGVHPAPEKKDGDGGLIHHAVNWVYALGDQPNSVRLRPKALTVSPLGKDECRALGHSTIEDSEICTKGVKACGSDYSGEIAGGGPLYAVRASNTTGMIESGSNWYLEGLASFGSVSCGDMGPVFTRVEPFIPWIRKMISRSC